MAWMLKANIDPSLMEFGEKQASNGAEFRAHYCV